MKKIPLTQGHFALVDDDNYDELAKYKWHVFRAPADKRYAVRGIWDGEKVRAIRMHRQILGAKPGQLVDHKDHDGLNNQRSNIRLCTSQQNTRYRRPVSGCSSEFKGVSWNKASRKWSAGIKIKGRLKSLGRFNREYCAAIAYDIAARKYFGDFAYTNFPESIEETMNEIQRRGLNI